MNHKLSFLTLLLLVTGTQPAQAGIWESLRNSRIVTAVFGKQSKVDYTQQTRLPVTVVQQTFWQRITNFFAWRNFKSQNSPQAQQPIAPTPGAPAESTNDSNAIPPVAGHILYAQLNQLQKKHADTLVQTEKLELQEKIHALETQLDSQIKKIKELSLNSTSNAQQEILHKLLAEKQAELEKYKAKTAEIVTLHQDVDSKLTSLQQIIDQHAYKSLEEKKQFAEQTATLNQAIEVSSKLVESYKNENLRIQQGITAQNKQITQSVNYFEHQMTHIVSRFDALNNRLNSMNGKIERNIEKLSVIKKLATKNQTTLPQLPIVFSATALPPVSEATDLKISALAAQANGAAVSSELLQSAVGAQNQALNTSVIGKEVESFSELPLTPSSSPELPNIKKDAPEIDSKLQIDPVYYSDQVTKGRKYADAIYENRLHDIPTATQQEYLQSLIALNWHLYDLAIQKGQGFVEGTFVVEGFELYDFHMAYAKRFNPDIKGTPQDPLLHVSYNPFAYSRDASHFTHLKPQYRPYGIDIRFGADKPSETLLPANKRHILYGKLDEEEKLFYLKIENFGIHTSDVVGHSKEYGSAQLGKNNFAASSIRAIASRFGYIIPVDSGEGNQKERTVPQFLTDFDETIAAAENLSNEHKKSYMGMARIEGFKMLYHTPLLSLPGIQALTKKYTNDAKKYDHMRWRTGQEVILSKNEWVPRLALQHKKSV